MSYFGGSSGMVGDPGFFGNLGGLFKRAVGVGVGLATGGPGGALAALTRRGQPPRAFRPPAGQIPVIAKPGLIGAIQRGIPGGATGLIIDPRTGQVRRRRRRINFGNPKALRRAIRRTDGFVTLAKGALKNTGFKIVSKSAGKMTEAAWQKKAHHAK